MADWVGQQLGNYHLLRLLGEGGFAEVYLGEHQHLGTQAAIKILAARLSTEEGEHFLQEAQTIARLKHPHIVRLLEFGVERSTPFLVMEYAPNGTLRQQHPKGQALAPTMILPYVQQVADALQYAHDRRLIHRDIKPENLLLGRNQDVLLSDFGIALVAQSTSSQRAQGVAGTIAYMAPEQVQGHARPASDQYALGVVIYEWLCGERPFQGSIMEVVAKHLHAAPPSLTQKVPTLSPAIEEVVLTALAKDPKARYANMRAFARAFEQACQITASRFTPLPTQPIPPSSGRASSGEPMQPPGYSLLFAPTRVMPPEPAGQSTRVLNPVPPAESPTIPVPLAHLPLTDQASHVAAAGPSAAAHDQPTPALPKPNTALPATEVLPPTPLALPQPTAPSPHRLSRRVVVAGLAGLVLAGSGVAVLELTRLSQGLVSTTRPTATPTRPTATPTPTPIPPGTTLYTYGGHTDQIMMVAWSPAGNRIASASWDKTVQVWDAFSGGNVLVYHGHASHVRAVAWSPNGQYLASASSDGTVQVWRASTGTLVFRYRGPVSSHEMSAVAWSPDGTRIASGSYDFNGQGIQIWDAFAGSNTRIFAGKYAPIEVLAWSPNGQYIATVDDNFFVDVWEVSTGHLLYTYGGPANPVATMSWSPDSHRIASCGPSTVQVWDALTGKNVAIYPGLAYPVSWSPDGTVIVSGTPDHTLEIWNPLNSQVVLTYYSGGGPLTWSPGGTYIASGLYIGSQVNVWLAR